MKFSIITASYRSGRWLKLCIQSVADQEGVEVEHIVQDSCSDDGTGDWLPSEPRVKAFIEKDTGMYDAINRGFAKASGEILAYLNCDEQYLPGALQAVHQFFVENPDVDVLVADAVVTDTDGNYICHRYGLRPIQSHLWFRFPVLTAALFLRSRVVKEYGIHFDTQLRVHGDLMWVMEFLRRGVKIGVLRRFTSTFADTGENLALSERGKEEKRAREKTIPLHLKILKPLLILHHRLRFIAAGVFWQKPFEYSLYTFEHPDQRTVHRVSKPCGIWHTRV